MSLTQLINKISNITSRARQAADLRGKAQNFLTDNHVHALVDAVHGFADIDMLARLVPVAEIAAKGYNLEPSRSRHTSQILS